ncbi:CD225/dispanin family protein [Pseudoxanthomonas mexicana]|uniref:CD225/dispanin family protein n=1 Tax=Pseudoxanthomonas mexicana TaxID=128785 RepID=UPI00398B8D55
MSAVPPLPPSLPPVPYVPSHLVWAILTTLFCCLPLGIVSIVYAAQVDGRRAMGDIAGALDASDKARFWAILSAAIAIVPLSLYLLFILVLGMIGALGG